MRSPPWRIPLWFTIRGICVRYASIVISIYMDGRFRIRKCWRGKSLYDFRTTTLRDHI